MTEIIISLAPLDNIVFFSVRLTFSGLVVGGPRVLGFGNWNFSSLLLLKWFIFQEFCKNFSDLRAVDLFI